MLRQIAEVEFPQMVRHYRTASSYEEPKEGAKRLTVELLVPHYDFRDFHATVVVQAKAYSPGRTLIFDKSYREEGDTQGAKMFWGGPFAMKSAIRQSSFQAYQAAFAKLRFDLGLFFVKPGRKGESPRSTVLWSVEDTRKPSGPCGRHSVQL